MAVVNSVVALSAILLTVNSMSVVVSDKKCVPMQWESVLLGLVAQSDNGKSAIYEVVGSIHYDYNKAMEAALENVYVDDKLIASYKIIVSQDESYIADILKSRCAKLHGAKIEAFCTNSPGLNYLGSWNLGNQVTDTYTMSSEGISKSYLTMFRDTFLPGTQNIQQSVAGIDQLTTVQFANATAGIKDPDVFILPDFCNSSMPITENSMASNFLKGVQLR
ncbi:uncharacterized protein [Watersipora subatra]|uniref:uncharacterized protein n=1 Tax=Watersipora subatra TaxID=2589382 RepID=UPI00355B2FD2